MRREIKHHNMNFYNVMKMSFKVFKTEPKKPQTRKFKKKILLNYLFVQEKIKFLLG